MFQFKPKWLPFKTNNSRSPVKSNILSHFHENEIVKGEIIRPIANGKYLVKIRGTLWHTNFTGVPQEKHFYALIKSTHPKLLLQLTDLAENHNQSIANTEQVITHYLENNQVPNTIVNRIIAKEILMFFPYVPMPDFSKLFKGLKNIKSTKEIRSYLALKAKQIKMTTQSLNDLTKKIAANQFSLKLQDIDLTKIKKQLKKFLQATNTEQNNNEELILKLFNSKIRQNSHYFIWPFTVNKIYNKIEGNCNTKQRSFWTINFTLNTKKYDQILIRVIYQENKNTIINIFINNERTRNAFEIQFLKKLNIILEKNGCKKPQILINYYKEKNEFYDSFNSFVKTQNIDLKQ